MFDASLGFEWALTPSFGLGPTLRYAQLASSSSDGTADAKFWSLGIAVTLRPAPPPPRREEPPPPPPPSPPAAKPVPKDSDKDGILDRTTSARTSPSVLIPIRAPRGTAAPRPTATRTA